MSIPTAATQHMVLTGDKDKFKELLHLRLCECGWRDQVRLLCKQIVKEKGAANITVDILLREVTPHARALVPDAVKKELLLKIKRQINLNQKMSLEY